MLTILLGRPGQGANAAMRPAQQPFAVQPIAAIRAWGGSWIPLLTFGLSLAAGLTGCGGEPAGERFAITDGKRMLDVGALDFVRIDRDDGRSPRSLDVSRVRFQPRSPESRIHFVDLYSAIHIGDKSYYHDLNRRFREYDAVLYELVAPAGTRVGARTQSDSVVTLLQLQLKRFLGLSFQLEEVDYSPRNLVHADLSPGEVARLMKERGESWMGVIAKVMMESMKNSAEQPWKPTDRQLLAALFARDRATRLKRVMAEQMADLKTITALYEGDGGSTLITERNKRALEILDRQIGRGQQKLAIFYGAGHMPDIARRLHDQFDLVPVEEEWLPAWDLQPVP